MSTSNGSFVGLGVTGIGLGFPPPLGFGFVFPLGFSQTGFSVVGGGDIVCSTVPSVGGSVTKTAGTTEVEVIGEFVGSGAGEGGGEGFISGQSLVQIASLLQ